MEKGTLAITIIIFVIAVLALILGVGTILPQIPLIGSVANFFTVHYAFIFLPVCLFLALIMLFIFILGKKSALKIITVVVIIAAMGLSAFAYAKAVKTLKDEGADVDVFTIFKKEDTSDVKVKTVVYDVSEYGENELNVYYTDGENKPVVIYIHGGGWIQGSKENHTYHSQMFAKYGYLSISVDYDLSTKDRHLSDKTELQLAKAFAWVKENAALYGGNANETYVYGDSAGGNLALNVSYKINGGVYADADGKALPKIKKIAALYPVADPAAFWSNDDIVMGKSATTMSEYYTGTTPDKDKEKYDQITSKNYVTAATPPTLIITGTADADVHPEMSYELIDVLKENGIPNKIIKVPYSNHTFDCPDGTYFSNAVFDLMKKWFSE